MKLARRIALVAAAFAVPACGNTPTEITPLPRSVGEVEGVLLQLDSLAPLPDRNADGVYVLWAIINRGEAKELGEFFISDSGTIVDAEGNPIERFESEDFAVRRTLSVLITIETPNSRSDNPEGTQILSGTFVDGVATLSVPISTDITSAAGSLRVFTPTDGPDTNETSGFWMADAEGEPLLSIPDTTAALVFETFVEVQGRSLPVGRFERADDADDVNQYSSDQFPAPEVPGEDLLLNAPDGLIFPADLGGARISISLEGRFNDFAQQGQLVVLEAFVPPGITGGETIPFTNRTASFPSGRAVLY
jgi:hypothetical protein